MAHISQTGNRLNELFHEIGCTDKHTTHSYGYFYGPFLEHKRTTAKNVLEIGVSSFGGGCLEAFALFFENANVYGIDISPCDRANRNVYPKNVTFIIGDAYHPNGPLQLLDDIQWDVVIDDGPHSWGTQLKTLNNFYHKLAPNGVVIIEDIGSKEIDNIFTGFRGDKNRLTVIDRMRNPQRSPNCDDNLIIYM